MIGQSMAGCSIKVTGSRCCVNANSEGDMALAGSELNGGWIVDIDVSLKGRYQYMTIGFSFASDFRSKMALTLLYECEWSFR